MCSYRAAAQGKRSAPAVARWEFRLGDHVLRLQRALAQQRWQPGRYQRFLIHEPKRRIISAAPFADRIVHHALMNITQPRFERSFSAHSYANRVGMGTHRAVQRLSHLCQQNTWALRLDVQQYFQSIDHEILLAALLKRIPEAGLARLVHMVVASGVEPEASAAPALYLPGDDLMAACRRRGLPIGNLTSQCWSNCYLDPLDQFIARTLGCRAYARYVDDLVLCANDKHTLATWADEVAAYARERLRLRLHTHSAQAQPTQHGVPWLGLVVYPTHRLLKSRKVVATTRRLTQAWRDWQLGLIDFEQLDAKVHGWIAHARQADSWRVRETVLSRLDITRGTGCAPRR